MSKPIIDQDILIQAVNQLHEHHDFDTVEILVTKTQGGDTAMFSWGVGNAYARRDALREKLRYLDHQDILAWNREDENDCDQSNDH